MKISIFSAVIFLDKKFGLRMFNVRKIRRKKIPCVYLRKSWFKFYQNPDPHWIRIQIRIRLKCWIRIRI
jgi:hypothetical protein